MRLAFGLLASLLVVTGSFAQAPALPNNVNIMVLPPTGNYLTVNPLKTQWSQVMQNGSDCNLDAPATATTLNPTYAYFRDPWRPTKFCRAKMPTGVPNGNGYRTVGVFETPTCQTSATSDFRTPCRSVRSMVAPTTFSVSGQAWIAPPLPPQDVRL